MYDRRYRDRTLRFEPSGGLLGAALVMRDLETDSWWGMLPGRAIGGVMNGEPLSELAGSEKTTWGDWRSRHPETLVLSVSGSTHVRENPYGGYLISDRTFRDVATPDHRLPAKEPVFAFRIGDQSFAVPHRVMAGGYLTSHLLAADPDSVPAVAFLYRRPGAPLLASSRAWRVPARLVRTEPGGRLFLDRGSDGPGVALPSVEALRMLPEIPGVSPLLGVDTFWYTWSVAHPGTVILR